jgi:hypothetical protein
MEFHEMKTSGLFLITGLLIGLTMWFTYDRIEKGIQKHRAEEYFARLENGVKIDKIREQAYQIKNEAIQITDQEENLITIQTASDRVIFIYLWASWNISSVENLSALSQLYEKTKGNIDFYLITGEQPAKINRVLKNQKLDLPCYFFKQQGDLPLFLQQTDLPYTCIIHRGKIRFEYWGIAPWDNEAIIHFIEELRQEEKRLTDLIPLQRIGVLNVINFN